MCKTFETISVPAVPFSHCVVVVSLAPSSVFNIFLMELRSICNIVTGAELILSILKAVAHVQRSPGRPAHYYCGPGPLSQSVGQQHSSLLANALLSLSIHWNNNGNLCRYFVCIANNEKHLQKFPSFSEFSN